MRFIRRDAQEGGVDTADNPAAGIGHALTAATVSGPKVGLALLEPLQATLEDDYRFTAARALLLEMAGHEWDALDDYRTAAEQAPNPTDERYLLSQASRLTDQLQHSS
jgi:predicted RNA polymerase sigma factor